MQVSSPSVECLEYNSSGVITNVTYPLPNTDINGIGVRFDSHLYKDEVTQTIDNF